MFFKNKSEKTKDKDTKQIEVEENSDIEFSLHSSDGDRISDYNKEYMQKEIEELPTLKKGDINISGVYLYDVGDQYEVKVYIRNGFTDNVNFDQVPFIIVNGKGDILARQIFDLKEMGDIPPFAAKPWKLYFDKSKVKTENIEHDDWKILFDKGLEAFNNISTVFEGIPEYLDESSQNQLDDFLNSLPKLKEGDFNISTFYVGVKENGGILIVFVIRNGMNENVVLNHLPVSVKDDSGKLVAGGIFDTNLAVGMHKAKVCNLEFASENVSKGEVNLKSLKVYFEFDSNAIIECRAEEKPEIEETIE